MEIFHQSFQYTPSNHSDFIVYSKKNAQVSLYSSQKSTKLALKEGQLFTMT